MSTSAIGVNGDVAAW